MEDKLIIGLLVKPQGIKGEMKMKCLADGYENVKRIKCVTIDGADYKVLSMRETQGDIYIALSSVADRNEAEMFRNKEVYAKREDIYLPKNKYYVCDVIGSEVTLTSGEYVGKVKEIKNLKNDVYYIEDGDKRCCFPLVDGLVEKIDVESKKIVLNAERFKEIALYEN